MEEPSLTQGEWDHMNLKFLSIDNMAANECLRIYSDKAKYLFLIDTDETFMPSKLSKFETIEDTFQVITQNDLETEKQVNKFYSEFLSPQNCLNDQSSYLNNFVTNRFLGHHRMSDQNSLYFPQVLFLKESLAEEFFAKIENSLKLNTTKIYPMNIEFFKKNDPAKTKSFKYESNSYDAKFTIVIENELEMKYAKNLLGLYQNLIKPFLIKHSKSLENESERLKRFLFLDLRNDNELSKHHGKSFHNQFTSTFCWNPHYTSGPYERLDSYYVSHFRKFYELGSNKKSIRRFSFDLSYFSCYAKKILS